MSDPTYPTYSVSVRWENDGEHNPEYPNWHKGLPAGRTWNSTLLHRMYREDPGVHEVLRIHKEEWWPGYVQAKLADKNPGPPMFTVEHTGCESWVLEWFSHYTFDVGQSDGEALASFERYVRRYEDMQDVWPGEYPEGYRCLMGAEDRWRWHGGSEPDVRTPAPCHCEFCQRDGVIRVNH